MTSTKPQTGRSDRYNIRPPPHQQRERIIIGFVWCFFVPLFNYIVKVFLGHEVPVFKAASLIIKDRRLMTPAVYCHPRNTPPSTPEIYPLLPPEYTPFYPRNIPPSTPGIHPLLPLKYTPFYPRNTPLLPPEYTPFYPRFTPFLPLMYTPSTPGIHPFYPRNTPLLPRGLPPFYP